MQGEGEKGEWKGIKIYEKAKKQLIISFWSSKQNQALDNSLTNQAIN